MEYCISHNKKGSVAPNALHELKANPFQINVTKYTGNQVQDNYETF